MRFPGTVEIERAAGAVVVPAEAVFNRPTARWSYRRTGLGHRGGAARARPAQRAAGGDLAGLAPGDRDLAAGPGGGGAE